MESDPTARSVHVNPGWLLRYLTISAQANTWEEVVRHQFLFFLKGLREVGHILTPVMGALHVPPINTTPKKIGHVKDGKRSGDAGYGLEEILSGARILHLAGVSSVWEIAALIYRHPRDRYEIISDSYLTTTSFKPTPSHLSRSPAKKRKTSVGPGAPSTTFHTKSHRVFVPSDIAKNGRKA